MSRKRTIAKEMLAATQATNMAALLVFRMAIKSPHAKPAIICPANTAVYITAQALPVMSLPLGHGSCSNLPDSCKWTKPGINYELTVTKKS